MNQRIGMNHFQRSSHGSNGVCCVGLSNSRSGRKTQRRTNAFTAVKDRVAHSRKKMLGRALDNGQNALKLGVDLCVTLVEVVFH